jgi:hypothetical protein
MTCRQRSSRGTPQGQTSTARGRLAPSSLSQSGSPVRALSPAVQNATAAASSSTRSVEVRRGVEVSRSPGPRFGQGRHDVLGTHGRTDRERDSRLCPAPQPLAGRLAGGAGRVAASTSHSLKPSRSPRGSLAACCRARLAAARRLVALLPARCSAGAARPGEGLSREGRWRVAAE